MLIRVLSVSTLAVCMAAPAQASAMESGFVRPSRIEQHHATSAATASKVKPRQLRVSLAGDRLGRRAVVSIRGVKGPAKGFKKRLRLSTSATLKRLPVGRYGVSTESISAAGHVATARVQPAKVNVSKRRGATVRIRFTVVAENDPGPTPTPVESTPPAPSPSPTPSTPPKDATDIAIDSLRGELGPDQSLDPLGTSTSAEGDVIVALQYEFKGVPLLGSQALVGVDGQSNITQSNSQPPAELDLDTVPASTAETAKSAALTRVSDALGVDRSTLTPAQPDLVILDPVRLGLDFPTRPTLVWQVRVTSESASWMVFVDAQDGTVALAYDEAASAKNRRICDTSPVPCSSSVVRGEGDGPSGNAAVDHAYEYLGDAYDYYKSMFGRDSFDGAGREIRATVNYPARAANAYYYPSGRYFRFEGNTEALNDVVAHEFTHGVVHASVAGGLGLLGVGEPGGLNEGLSDVFGEFIDQRIEDDNDPSGSRWLVGESAGGSGPFGPSLRNMKNPAADRMPAEVEGRYWPEGTGEVHQYATVAGHFAYLLTDGDAGVIGIGEDKAARIIYRSMQFLTQSATFTEWGRVLGDACHVLDGTHGITNDDCAQVHKAADATGLLGYEPPAHPKTVGDYIARNPRTGRSLLVTGNTVNVIPSGLFNCLAKTRVVWDVPNLRAFTRAADGVQLNCFPSSNPVWTYTPTADGGNTGTGIILRDAGGHAWLINGAGEIQTIESGATYLCLARSNPVLWDVPGSKIGDWRPVGSSPATCGNAAPVDCSEITVVPNDDGSSDQITLPMSLNFGGRQFGSVWVNNNGNLTFDGSMSTYTPFDLTTSSQAVIAPFFADVDTRGQGSGIATAGRTSFEGHRAFCANWDHVGYYSQGADRVNTFQVLLVDRSDVSAGDFDIVFNYTGIEWDTGSASGGISAGVGYSNGQGLGFELPGSRVPSSFLDSGPKALVSNSNVGKPGRYVWSIR